MLDFKKNKKLNCLLNFSKFNDLNYQTFY